MSKLLTQEQIERIKYRIKCGIYGIAGSHDITSLLDHIDALTEKAPTEWAYQQACAAIEKHRERAGKAEEEIKRLTETIADNTLCAKGSIAHYKKRAEKAEAELKRRDALAGEVIGYIPEGHLDSLRKNKGKEHYCLGGDIWCAQRFSTDMPLYAAPPAPAVPDAMKYSNPACECSDDVEHDIYAQGWNAYRAAMLANKDILDA